MNKMETYFFPYSISDLNCTPLDRQANAPQLASGYMYPSLGTPRLGLGVMLGLRV